ncbi:hypothetical protein ACG0Z4_29415 [Enterocloster aldenensis]|uniref:hypothetical protein n=1 Tax=Enterocloster aldenensis TaxID=358742 RepID=UPI0040286F67
MASILCIFMPPIFSILVYDFIRRDNKFLSHSIGQCLKQYCAFCTIDNLIAMSLMSMIFDFPELCVQGEFSDNYLSKKYMLLLVIVSIAVSVAFSIVKEYFDINIYVEGKGLKEKNEKEIQNEK